MQRSVFTFTLAAATAVTLSLFQPTTVRAADVTLTSGSITFNCLGPASGDARINLVGTDFSLIFTYSARPVPMCLEAEQRLLPARFDAVSFATFQGITTQEMTGFLSFDETTLMGFVEGRDLHNPQNLLFAVNFTGAGVGVITSTRSTFEVGAVPEPATLALLSVGVAALGAARRYKSRRTQKSQTWS